jgi:hydroxymethylglutaryl-CoA lyase
MTRAQSFKALSDVNALAGQAKAVVNVSLSCSFGCPMEGDVPVATVLDWCARYGAGYTDMGGARRHAVRHDRMAYPGRSRS